MTKNKLYELCESHIGSKKDRIGVKFYVGFPEEKIVRKEDALGLYFSVLNSVLSEDDLRLLHEVSYLLRTMENNRDLADKFNKMKNKLINGKA